MQKGQCALLAPKKETYYPKLQSDPQLGGEGSGFPPAFCVAAGQQNRIVLGIDLGSQYMRVSALDEDYVKPIVLATATTLGLTDAGYWGLAPDGLAAGQGNQFRSLIRAARTKLGTDWHCLQEGEVVDGETLTRLLLYKMTALARARSQKSLRDVVLTVPASYTSMERKQLKAACQDMELSVVQLINEPTAVALAYYVGSLKKGGDEGNFLLFHMGASSCAATVYSIVNGILEIKATSAEHGLGGQSFDEIIVDFLVDTFTARWGAKPHLDEQTLQRFEQEAAKIKQGFAFAGTVFYKITNLAFDGPTGGFKKLSSPAVPNGQIFLEGQVSRETFDFLTHSAVTKAVGHVYKALAESQIPAESIKKMLVCGGATLLPTLREALSEVEGIVSAERLDDDMLPSQGAAFQANLICDSIRDVVVWDLLTQPINLIREDGGTTPLIAANTPLPVTAYSKIAITGNTIVIRLSQGDAQDEASLSCTELVINNCPPASANAADNALPNQHDEDHGNQIELAVRVNQDGIISYGARHIGLGVALLVTALQDEKRHYKQGVERFLSASDIDVSGPRAQRLARILNMPLRLLPGALRGLGYVAEQIVSGQAIELALRKIKTERRRKKVKPIDEK
ncbi:MAG: Hsp70 family protein [Cyanobacteria bacterium REEB67]|nr:Hsp70 family protein [Cyanobacteria bacterium REEB67]